MEFQKQIRMHMWMVGLGAALLMAGSARAQQDMDPTYFDVNPGTPDPSKAIVRVAQSPAAAKSNGQAESALAMVTGQEETLEAGVTRMAIVDVGVTVILFVGVFSIAAYALVGTRRARSLKLSRVSAAYTRVSAATAQ